MNFLLIQIKLLLQKKSAVFCYLLLLGFVSAHFLQNVFAYAGKDVSLMYHPMQLLLLFDNNIFGYYLVRFLPILAVIPCGFSYFEDRASGEQLFWMARIGKREYFRGKLAAVFLVTTIVFAAPLLLEVLLNAAAFPLHANGLADYSSRLEAGYWSGVRQYLFPELYIASKYLYAVVCCLFFGVVCAVLAAFTVSLSLLPVFKFRIILFLPVYLLLTLTYYVQFLFPDAGYTDYSFFLYFCDPMKKSWTGFACVLAALIVGTVFLVNRKCRKDVFGK